VQDGARPGAPRNGRVFVVFGAPSDLVGWSVADAARPTAELLDRVRHFPQAVS
jgi:hypothetical protein